MSNRPATARVEERGRREIPAHSPKPTKSFASRNGSKSDQNLGDGGGLSGSSAANEDVRGADCRDVNGEILLNVFRSLPFLHTGLAYSHCPALIWLQLKCRGISVCLQKKENNGDVLPTTSTPNVHDRTTSVTNCAKHMDSQQPPPKTLPASEPATPPKAPRFRGARRKFAMLPQNAPKSTPAPRISETTIPPATTR